MSAAQLAGRHRGARDPLDGLRQPRAALGARGLQLAGAVDLLGHVGQVEVGREGADEADRRERIDLGEDGGGGVAIRAHEPAHALDEVEHLAPLLAHDRAPQQHAELADVAAQRGLGLVAGGGGALGEHRWPCMVTKWARLTPARITRRGLRPPPRGGRRARPSRRASSRSWRRGRAGRRRRPAAPRTASRWPPCAARCSGVTPSPWRRAAEGRAAAGVGAEVDEPADRGGAAARRGPHQRAAAVDVGVGARAARDERLEHLDAVAARRPGERLVEDLLRIVRRAPVGEAAVRAVVGAVRAGLRRQAPVGRDELLDEVQAPEPGGGAQVARVHAALGQHLG